MANTTLGLITAAIAVLFFGSNFVVLKGFRSGDGMFYQWVMASGIFVVGLIVWFIRGPTNHIFEPWACFGGVLWCSGNVWVVPIVRAIGLGMGLLIWGASNMLVGWATGRFGWFGVTEQHVSHPTMNTIGVVVAVVGLFLYLFVEPEEHKKVASKSQYDMLGDYPPGERGRASSLGSLHAAADELEDDSFVDHLSPGMKRAFGIIMSLVSGALYGSNFTPPQYVEDHRSERKYMLGDSTAPNNLIDYAFPHFCGIFMTSTVFFIGYCAYKRNRPVVYPEICLPGFASGVMWAIAQCGWFVANQNLSLPVSFPIVTVGPGLVGALWGVFVFGEIKGTKNYCFLGAAFVVSIAAAVTIALSH